MQSHEIKRERRVIVLSTIGTLCILAVIFEFFLKMLPVPRERVVGTYVCRHPYGTEYLELRQDGVFSQTIDIPGQPKKLNSGKWEIREMRDQSVGLSGAILIDDHFGRLASDQTPTDALWLMTIERSLTNHIYMTVSEDLSLYFVKE